MDPETNLSSPVTQPKAKVPHTFVILFGLIVIMAISTYFLPAGEFDRTTNDDGLQVVINGSYHEVSSNPAGFLDVFYAIYNGMVKAVEIIFFLLIIGGTLGILGRTGAIDIFLNNVLDSFHGREIYVVPALLGFFAISGATFGMSEESIPYLMIILPILLRIGFDPIVIVSLPLVGTAIGWAGSFTNPFNVGLAQSIAEVPLFSGIFVRIILLMILYCISAWYFIIYARRILYDPKKSLVYTNMTKEQTNIYTNKSEKDQKLLQKRRIAILLTFVITIIIVPTGIIMLDWFIMEISGIFLIMGIIVGLLAKMNYNDIANAFTNGCKDLMVAALAVGFAYGALTILEDSKF